MEGTDDTVGSTSKSTDRQEYVTRWMIRRDMRQVLDTEKLSFESAWTEYDFLCCLKQRNCIGMIAEHGDRVVGFMIYELQKSILYLTNFAVDPEFRRSGVGSLMVDRLKSKLSNHRRKEIQLHVRESNLAAHLFFRSQGFWALRVERGFYEENGEDAYLMSFINAE